MSYHRWSELRTGFLESPARRCDGCGVVQTRVTEYAWGRISRRYWSPRVGRCKPKKDQGVT